MIHTKHRYSCTNDSKEGIKKILKLICLASTYVNTGQGVEHVDFVIGGARSRTIFVRIHGKIDL